MTSTNCWPRQSLKNYVHGWMDESESVQLESHLAECTVCEQTLAALEAEPETLAEILPSALALAKTDNEDSDQSHSMHWALGKAAPLISSESQNRETASQASISQAMQIGPYLLLRPLGQGGMGAVFLAKHLSLGKQVAIKLLPVRIGSTHFAARFQREIRTAGGLNHPAIVSATDAGEANGTHYLVMEFIDGCDLSKIARVAGELSIADGCELVRQAALGLSHAHAAGIVHRDIKPSNLMLNRRGQVKILDFGLARLGSWNDASLELTTVGQLLGTLDYMAPEQAERPDSVDYRADLYSLGATLFRLLTGRAPLAAAPNQSPLTKLRLMASGIAPKLSTLRTDSPEGLVHLLALLLAPTPESRPASAAHLAEQLEPFCSGNNLVALLQTTQDKWTDGADANVNATRQQFDPAAAAVAVPQGMNPLAQLHIGNPAENTKTSGKADSSQRRLNWYWTVAMGLLFFAASYAGITLWLEQQKGWLHIDSQAAVTVKLLEDDSQVKQLTVEPGETSTKLYAGRYQIILDQGSDRFELDRGEFQLLKGGVVVAKITPRTSANQLDALNSDVPSAVDHGRVYIPPASMTKLAPGDQLHLYSSTDDSLKSSFPVHADLTIKVPLVGTISAANMSVEELERELEKQYSRFLNKPSIQLFRRDPNPVPIPGDVPPPSYAKLAPGDRLTLDSLSTNELKSSFTVQADLTAKLPLIGTVSVANLTVDEFARKLENEFRPFVKVPAIQLFRDPVCYRSLDPSRIQIATIPSPTADVPVTNDSTSEPLYRGKTLDEWMRVVARDRDSETVKDGLTALCAVYSSSTKEHITEFLRRELPRFDWYGEQVGHDFLTAFSLLRRADPENYNSYMKEQLSGEGNDSFKLKIVRWAMVEDRNNIQIAAFNDWFRESVLFGDKNTSLLDPTLELYAKALSIESLDSRERNTLMKTLSESPRVTVNWISTYLGVKGFAEMGLVRTIKIFSDPQATPNQIADAFVFITSYDLHLGKLSGQPMSLANRLSPENLNQLSEAWKFRSKQLAEDPNFRETHVKVTLSSHLQQILSESYWFPNYLRFQVPPLMSSARELSMLTLLTTSLGGFRDESDTMLIDALIPAATRAIAKKIPGLFPWPHSSLRNELLNTWSQNAWSSAQAIPHEKLPIYPQTNWDESSADLNALMALQYLCPLPLDPWTSDSPEWSIYNRTMNPIRRTWLSKKIARFDQDQNGQLTYAEYESWRQAESKLDQQASSLFTDASRWDSNADQSVDIEEALDAIGRVIAPPPSAKVSRNPDEADLQAAAKAIAKYDTNKDGSLSTDEQAKMVIPIPKTADLNQDGYIDASEYAEYRSK